MPASAGESGHGLTLGVDVGGTKVLGVAVDSSGSVVCQARAATPLSHHHDPGEDSSTRSDGTNRLIAAIAEVVGHLMAGTGSEPGTDAMPSLGVGVPGLVDDDGTMHFAPNLPAGAGVDFKARSQRRHRDTQDRDRQRRHVRRFGRVAARGSPRSV